MTSSYRQACGKECSPWAFAVDEGVAAVGEIPKLVKEYKNKVKNQRRFLISWPKMRPLFSDPDEEAHRLVSDTVWSVAHGAMWDVVFATSWTTQGGCI